MDDLTTRLSCVDPDGGRLIVAETDIRELGQLTFQEAAEALLEEPLDLGPARVRAWAQLAGRPRPDDGMDALRMLVASTTAEDPSSLIATVAVAAALWMGATEPPDPDTEHVTDILRMCGLPADPARVRALSTYLITVMDHGLNASTFAARVVVSTGSDAVSAVVAAIGALKGPLHGGAPGPVLEMLHAIGRPERARPWIEAELAAGRRIMGLGHRVYRARDPRAEVLEDAASRLAAAGVAADALAMARAVEAVAVEILSAHKPGRELRANVEFYTAVLLDAIGLPPEAFTVTFAMGRVVGWLAHVKEQRQTGRLIRPRATYVGQIPEIRQSA